MYYLGTKLFVYLSLFIHEVFSGGKVLGGREALQGEFPFAVRIGGRSLCGGALVTLVKLVSAVHCFEKLKPDGTSEKEDLSLTTVIAGTVNYKDQSGGFQERSIKSYIKAKGAKKKHAGSTYHDVAVVELDKPFETSDTVKVMTIKTLDPIKFKESWDEYVSSGQKCLGIGWGATQINKKNGEFVPSAVSDVLKVVEMIPWTDKACSETVWEEDTDLSKDGDVCLSPVKASETILPGDSGGPLVCSGMVWGVLSSRDKPDQIPNNSTSHYYLFFKYIDELKLTDATVASALKPIPTPFIIYHMLLFLYH